MSHHIRFGNPSPHPDPSHILDRHIKPRLNHTNLQNTSSQPTYTPPQTIRTTPLQPPPNSRTASLHPPLNPSLSPSSLNNQKHHVDHNEDVGAAARAQINSIFAVCSHLQGDDKTEPAPLLTSDAVKALAVNLDRLRIRSSRIRLKMLDSSIANMRSRLQDTRNHAALDASHIETLRTTLRSLIHNVLLSYTTETEKVHLIASELASTKLPRVQHRINLGTSQHFDVLREIAFGSKRTRGVLLFSEPIIELSDIWRVPLHLANSMLVNLIRLQSFLSRLLRLHLPHLESLIRVLPRYSLEEAKVSVSELNTSHNPSSGPSGITGSMIMLGDTTRLPVSSKTINNQRRASLKRGKSMKEETKLLSSADESIPIIKKRTSARNTDVEETTLYTIAQIFSGFFAIILILSPGTPPSLSINQILMSIRDCNGTILDTANELFSLASVALLASKIRGIWSTNLV